MSLCVIQVNQAQAKSNKPDMDPQLLCLAKNIYYEAGLEGREGMMAVAQVTVNRTQHEKFPSTICGVVNQKTEVVKTQRVTHTEVVRRPFWAPKTVERQETVQRRIKVCQFSWVCKPPAPVRYVSDRWEESLAVATEVMYQGLRLPSDAMSEALYFHNTHVRPHWGLERIARIGNHIFYSDDPAPSKK
jgi:spore germination cell wall hydrolase CwlJ-like protein